MLKPIGALWKKVKPETTYLSGKIEAAKLQEVFPKYNLGDLQILVFQNKKEKDTQPDYRIQLSLKDEDAQMNSTVPF